MNLESEKKSYAYFWGVVLFALPLYMRISPFTDPRVTKDMFFLWMGLISLMLFGIRQANNKLQTLLIGLSFLGWWTQYHEYSFNVFFQFLMLNLGILLILQMTSYFRDSHEKILLNFFAATCLLQCLWIVMNTLGHDPYMWYLPKIFPGIIRLNAVTMKQFDPLQKELVDGSLGNRNLSGALIAICAPAVLRRWGWVFLPLIIYALKACESEGPMITFAFSFLFLAATIRFSSRKVLLGSFFAFLILCGTFLTVGSKDDSSVWDDGERYLLWKNTSLNVLKSHPVLGKGLGYFIDRSHEITQGIIKQKFNQLHNEYVETLFAFGLVGVVLASILILPVFKYSHERHMFAILLGFLINSTHNFPGRISSLAITFLISYSYLMRGNRYGFFKNNEISGCNGRVKVSDL